MENDLIAWPLALWPQHKAIHGTERDGYVGEGPGVTLDVDVNVGKRRRNTGRAKKDGVMNPEKGKKRTTKISGRTGTRTHRKSTRGQVRQETKRTPKQPE